MVTISMTPSAGQSVFSFLMRVGGTAAAMCSSYIVWYIVDGHTAGGKHHLISLLDCVADRHSSPGFFLVLHHVGVLSFAEIPQDHTSKSMPKILTRHG